MILAALILSKHPTLTSYEIERIIELTADDKGDPGWDEYYGYGRINAGHALKYKIVPYYYATIESALSASSSGDTVFVAPGTYTPSDNLTISSGRTLLMPFSGTTVKMSSGKGIYVYGKLHAENVLFTYNGTGSAGAWYGISIDSDASDSSYVNKCSIKYASGGIVLYGTKHHKIYECTIDSCSDGIIQSSGGYFELYNTVIRNCTDEGLRFYYSSSPANIWNNTIEYNGGPGISCDHSSPNIWKCRIKYNEFGLDLWNYAAPSLIPSSANYETMIYDNDSSEVYCGGYYCDATLGTSAGGYPSTQNVIKDDAGNLIKILNESDVSAYKIWWGSNPPDTARFSVDGSSSLSYIPYAQTDPQWTGKSAAGQIAELSPYREGRQMIAEGNIEVGIKRLKEQITLYPDSRDAHHALAKLYSLHQNGEFEKYGGDFVEYLGNVASSYQALRMQALSLSAIVLTHQGYYGDVIELYDYLLSDEYGRDPMVVDASFHFYLSVMGNIEKAQALLALMKNSELPVRIKEDAEDIFEFTRQFVKPYQGALKKKSAISLQDNATGQGKKLPIEYNLHAAYPNPFNPATHISFDLPERSKVQLTVYNILGQNIKTLINETLPAGTHQRIWNAAQLSSGIYFIRMTTDKYVKTQKIMLLK